MVFRGHEVNGTACASGPRSGPGSAAQSGAPLPALFCSQLFELSFQSDYTHGEFVALSSVRDVFRNSLDFVLYIYAVAKLRDPPNCVIIA